VTRWRYIVVFVLGLTGLAASLVAGHHPWDGPELFELTGGHGVNLGDLPGAAAWITGAGLGWRVWRRERH
jgi:hypothetical protein